MVQWYPDTYKMSIISKHETDGIFLLGIWSSFSVPRPCDRPRKWGLAMRFLSCSELFSMDGRTVKDQQNTIVVFQALYTRLLLLLPFTLCMLLQIVSKFLRTQLSMKFVFTWKVRELHYQTCKKAKNMHLETFTKDGIDVELLSNRNLNFLLHVFLKGSLHQKGLSRREIQSSFRPRKGINLTHT